jgi:hypothetical protein
MSSVPFDVGVVYTSGGGLYQGRYVNIYSLCSVNYCRLITVLFIAGLLWETRLWIMGLMTNGLLHCPVGPVKATMLKWMKN